MALWKKTMLETGIDDFLELVATKETITLEQITEELSLSPETAESWAEILSKEGLITTNYDRKGNIILSNTKKNTKEKENHIKELTTNVQADIINVEANVHSKEKALKDEEKTLLDFEKLLKKDLDKSLEIETELNKITKHEAEIRKIFETLDTKEKQIQKEAITIKHVVNTKSKKIQEIEKELKTFESKKEKLLDDIKLIKKISKVLNVPAKDMDKNIEDIEQKVLEIRKLNNTVNQKYGIVKKLFSKM